MFADLRLREDVLAEIQWEPGVAGEFIHVSANCGVVTLSGHVGSYAQKSVAEAAARRVNAVRAVVEQIEVRLPPDMTQTDDAITAAAVACLSSDIFVPKDAVQVVVEDGRVSLTGQVDWWFQRDAVEQDIRPLPGVVGVSNQTTIRSRAAHPDLGDGIVDALYRPWFLNPGDDVVSIDDGRVRQSGVVRFLRVGEAAWLAAGSAPGAKMVENDIVVL